MHRITLLASVCLVAMAGCTKAPRTDNSAKPYIDLAAFFKNEAARLQKADPSVDKTIAKNNSEEHRTLKIRSWTNELSVFAASDINKSAWKDSYEIKGTGDFIEYLAKDKNLRTRKITVQRAGPSIKHVAISNSVANSLYSSDEILDYYTDSAYVIRKKQKVILMGSNDYFVSGKLK